MTAGHDHHTVEAPAAGCPVCWSELVSRLADIDVDVPARRTLGDRYLAPIVGKLADLLGWLDRRLADANDVEPVDEVDANDDGDDVPGLHR
jgi:hypothetical protein